MPFSKGELGRHDLYRFILERHKGKLEYTESMLESMQRDLNRQQGRRTARLRKFMPYENVLLPDSERLEHYLAGLLGMMDQLHHRAAALFEIIPSWLRFFELQRLIDTNTAGAGCGYRVLDLGCGNGVLSELDLTKYSSPHIKDRRVQSRIVISIACFS